MNERILLVEDSPTQGETLRAILADYGFQVSLVTSGEAALGFLNGAGRGGVDLVLSDVVMPGIDGYELSRRIKADQQLADLPVVLITSLSDPMAIVRGLECGADNYVTKPYTTEYLLARIRNALDKLTLRNASRTSMGINVQFLDTSFTITSGREQILDLFISSIEDVVRTNDALLRSQRELASTQKQLEEFAGRMARQAQVTAEKYSVLMHSATDAIVVLEKDCVIADSNPRASQLLGSTLPLLGRSLLDFVTPEVRRSLSAQLNSLREGHHVSVDNIELRRAVGDSVYTDLSASRSTDDGENLTLVILHDVTERRNYEEGLRLSAEKLREAQAIAGMGSFEWDLESGKISWSDQVYRIFGHDPETFTPTYDNAMGFVVAEDLPGLEDALKTALERRDSIDHEFTVRRVDETLRHIHMQAEVRTDEIGKPVTLVGTVLDITERKQLREQLLQSQKMEAVGQLAGGIAHDFNNLLTVIHGNSDLALMELDPASTVHADISEIKSAAISAASLTRQLLAFSRKQVLQPRPIQLRTVAENVQKMLARLIGENIDLSLHLDESAGFVLADPGQVEQVLINLTVNARDAMPEGGRIVIRTTTVEVDGNSSSPATLGLKPGRYELLTVTDTGTGMDAQTQARIFEPFFTTKPAGRGTGLGLSTVHGIVKQSGGEITVSSAAGKGTIFSIFLPQTLGERLATRSDRRARPVMGSETILLVEDEAPLRKLARRVLEKKGYQVLEASDGESALAICETEGKRINLVVSDVVMPGMTAQVMAEGMRSFCPGVRILFMSGYNDDAGMLDIIADGRTDFLQKPFSPQDLAEKVRAVLERSPSESSQPA